MSNVSEGIIHEIKKVICGKDYVIAQMLTAILAGGHILMEDVPGVGKTTMALAFSKTMGLNFGRVHQPGAIFHNLFLADELNRASSRTQSALLEAMEESSVTVDGTTYMLPKPFIVFATQNPTGASGTSLLPDSQIDRFMVRISIGYPSSKDEKAMIEQRKNGINPMDSVRPLCDANALLQMQSQVNNVFLHDQIADYIIALVNKTRGHADLERGASPRASLAFTSMAKAHAYMQGREYVVPKDVQQVFLPVITHRLMLNPEAEVNGKSTTEIAKEILASTFVPKV